MARSARHSSSSSCRAALVARGDRTRRTVVVLPSRVRTDTLSQLVLSHGSGMVERLTELGFTVTCWLTPFAALDSAAYVEGRQHGYWIRSADGTGEPAIIRWWQGDGVALNVSSDTALQWMERRMRRLLESSGISGFKFVREPQPLAPISSPTSARARDAAVCLPQACHLTRLILIRNGVTCVSFSRCARVSARGLLSDCRDLSCEYAQDAGEAAFVPAGTLADPNAYARRWAGFAARFGGGSEVRAAHASQSAGIWTREFDKDSRWGVHNGLRALLIAALHQGVLGYPFVLPDMVGGNAYSEGMAGGDGIPLDEIGGDLPAPYVTPPTSPGGDIVVEELMSEASSTGGSSSVEGRTADARDSASESASERASERASESASNGTGGSNADAGSTADGDADGVSAAPPAAALSSLFFGSLPPREMYIRWCAANALLPAVQFSIAPWQYDSRTTTACLSALALREARLPLLESLAANALVTGEPIVRPLWWHDPSARRAPPTHFHDFTLRHGTRCVSQVGARLAQLAKRAHVALTPPVCELPPRCATRRR